MADITIGQVVVEVDITATQNGQSYELQPVLVVNGNGGGSGAVDSVNGETGVVVLDADDISDATTANKYTSQADKDRLANTSGNNTGDQNISGIGTNATAINTLQGNRLLEVQAGANVTIDNTDPLRPIVNAAGGGASTDIEVVLIDTAEYTLLEADIEAFKIFAIQDVAATENVTITIPTTALTALTGVQFINIRHEGGGNTTIIPSSGVNQVKYESSSEKAITLVSRTANVWELSRGEAIASDYVAPLGDIPTYIGATQQDAAVTDVIAVTGMTPTTGNLLIATITYFTGDETISAPAGWTSLGSDFVNFPINAIFYKISDGSETNVSFLCSNVPTSNPHLATIYEFSGVNQTTPIESFALNAGVQALSAPLPSLTTTGQNRLAVGLIMNVMGDDNETPVTITGDWTERFNLGTGLSSDSRQLMYTQDTATASTISSETITFPFADWIITAVLAINPT